MFKLLKSSISSSSEGKLFSSASVYGKLHSPDGEMRGGVVLAHSAGSNCESPLLIAVASVLAANGFHVLRCNLPFRQRRAGGPPHPSMAKEDREGLRAAALAMRNIAPGTLILGGHSYGGRQATMLAAEDASVADSLLLLSYPLHPTVKRTAHFPSLTVPSLFVHGAKDSFGTVDEMRQALTLIPAATGLSVVEGAGHDLARGRFDVEALIVAKMFPAPQPISAARK